MAYLLYNDIINPGLSKAILEGNCVVFIGSGLSVASGYASWPDLVNKLCFRCGSSQRVTEDSPGSAFLDAAQDAKRCDEKTYLFVLGEDFGRHVGAADLIYDALLSLPFQCYMTVNFDPVLALKARTAREPCSLPPHVFPALDRKTTVNRTIHYLHGMICENEIPAKGPVVLSHGEFSEAYSDAYGLKDFLITTLENEPIVFIGCRLEEPPMEALFKISRERQAKRLSMSSEQENKIIPPPPRFILLPFPHERHDEFDGLDTNISEVSLKEQETNYRNMKIEPLWYDGRENHHILRYALEQLAKLPKVTPHYDWRGDHNAP